MQQVKLAQKIYLSEKAQLMGGLNKYVFLVDKNANKNEIKKEIKKQYKVEPVSINIICVTKRQSMAKGKFITKGQSKKLIFLKKAIVTLKKGQTISISK
ncbi:MAG: 50S ribosomal protein L23 [Candidatus Liptonbacteria bacterium]|nr:50S ribosomal protein L23 [Candidatus Liptonbacteria bacterium]